MTAEFAKAEVIAKRFGKTIADVNAAENASILANSAALKQLNAERLAAKSELERYNAALSKSSGFENDRLKILKDQSVWEQKLAAFRASKGGNKSVIGDSMTVVEPEAARKIREYQAKKASIMGGGASNFQKYISIEQGVSGTIAWENKGKEAGKTWFSGFAKNLQGHGSGGIQQLIHVGRATVDSLASGMSPWRVMMQQAPQAFQAFASMGGTAALKFITAFGTAFAAIGAIIAAPFIYFSRVNGLAERLAPRKLIDFSREYIPLVDKTADGLYRMAKAAQRVNEEYRGATASAARFQKQLDDQFETQKQLDAQRKENEIQRANGDTAKIAEIENRYGQLEVQRAQEKALADKQAKQAELKALQKEVADLEARKAGIKVGDDGKHAQVLATAKARAEDAQKMLDEENKRQNDEADQSMLGRGVRKAGKWIGNMYQSGGLGEAMIPTPGTVVGGIKKGNELGKVVDEARQKDLDLARQQVKEYQKLMDAENARNKAIEERNRLQGDSEKNSARIAQLQNEIADADKNAAAANNNMTALEEARAENRNQKAANGQVVRNRDLTANQRIGAYAMPQVQTQIELQKKTNEKLDKIVSNTDPAKQNGFDAAFGGN